MTHAPRRDELADLALGLLEGGPARALEAHAAGCPECRAELAALRQTRQLVASLPQVEAPAGGAAPLLAAARRVTEAVPAPRRAAPRWLWGGTLGLAGAAAVAILVLRVTPTPTGPGEPEPGPAVATSPAARGAEPVAGSAKAFGAGPEEAAPARPEPRVASAPTPTRPRLAPPAPASGSLVERARDAVAEVSAATGVSSRATLAVADKAERAVAPPPAPPAALLAAPAGVTADAEGPACRLEQRRRFTRDAAGRVVGRTREGRYPAAGSEVPLLVEERFGPDGRLLGATVQAGGRRFTVSGVEAEAGRGEPLPGVVLAPTAAEAERTPPRCQP